MLSNRISMLPLFQSLGKCTAPVLQHSSSSTKFYYTLSLWQSLLVRQASCFLKKFAIHLYVSWKACISVSHVITAVISRCRSPNDNPRRDEGWICKETKMPQMFCTRWESKGEWFPNVYIYTFWIQMSLALGSSWENEPRIHILIQSLKFSLGS